MHWLITLETEQDLIVTCRLMNVFRRKGMKITTLAMCTRPHSISMMAVLESPESDIGHLFNFLRGMEGVERVSYYQHQTFADASFVFIDADADTARAAEVLNAFLGSKLVFASQGKYLFRSSRRKPPALTGAGFRSPGISAVRLCKNHAGRAAPGGGWRTGLMEEQRGRGNQASK